MAMLGPTRDAVLDRLAWHYGRGHLRIGTLEYRVDAALAARSPADLDALLWDLPHPERLLDRLGLRPAPTRCARIAFDAGIVTALEITETSHTWTIGRSRSCDVVLGDPRVSRRHATIGVRGGECRVRDLASLNGLTLNGRAVRGVARLEPGDELVLGDAVRARVR